jgi:hypothetical protein
MRTAIILKNIPALLIVGTALAGLFFSSPAYGHEFSSNESSAFLALVEGIRVELDLAQSNLPTNATMATEHAAHAHEHLDEDVIEEIAERNERLGRDLPAALEELHMMIGNSSAAEVQSQIQNINSLLDETVSVRIDPDQLTNSTTQAVFVATLVDGALEHYKIAHGIGSNGSGHGGNETHDSHDSESQMTMEDGHDTEGNHTAGAMNATLVDMVSYQTALGLSDRAVRVFNETVAELAPANSTEAVADIKAGLAMLNQSIADRAPPDEVEVIVHSDVHPHLQTAFNLQIVPEFPVAVLVGIAAVGSMVALGRTRFGTRLY